MMVRQAGEEWGVEMRERGRLRGGGETVRAEGGTRARDVQAGGFAGAGSGAGATGDGWGAGATRRAGWCCDLVVGCAPLSHKAKRWAGMVRGIRRWRGERGWGGASEWLVGGQRTRWGAGWARGWVSLRFPVPDWTGMGYFGLAGWRKWLARGRRREFASCCGVNLAGRAARGVECGSGSEGRLAGHGWRMQPKGTGGRSCGSQEGALER
jgi:hypothetical protein